VANTDEVLVTILNDRDDFVAARDQHWYRIPEKSQEKWLDKRWPPKWVAFYQTNEFGPEAHAVHWYAGVRGISNVSRREIFPNEPPNAKSNKRYSRLDLEPLQRVPSPIVSRKARKIVFIPTTWEKFAKATEINDLFDDSPLENRLWEVFKERQIPAERQYFLEIESEHYALDFAIWCENGKVNVEADGDTFHTSRDRSTSDRQRDNALTTYGWRVLRFSTPQVMENPLEDCLARVIKNVNELGGIDEGQFLPRKIEVGSLVMKQKGLFDGTG
jgi:very-short-patch-repair endonuclease